MRQIGDIFGIWPSLTEMAKDLGEKPDTVHKWHRRKRIPESAWPRVIARAAKREKLVTASQLLELNGPIKKRGGGPLRVF